jgi:glutamine---fructose-6-phosphate transaminase (isomerizing)
MSHGLQMTRFLDDILRQPGELNRALHHLSGPGRTRLEEAGERIRQANTVYLTGIGSSWHAGLCAASLFSAGARPVCLQDAADVAHFANLPRNAVLIVLSRSGKSVEIVSLLEKARESGASVVAITNAEDSPLALAAQVPIVVPVTFDHAISVNTYSTIALAAGLVAQNAVASLDEKLTVSLACAVRELPLHIESWQEQIAKSRWLLPGAAHYFLARGSSLGSCHETCLLWEEGVKSPATAMGTSSFRHGPQEMLREGMRVGIWIDPLRMREEDFALARDLRRLGASVMLIGQNLPQNAADLVLEIPEIPAPWQFLIDIIPAQLAAERLARQSGADPDSFRYCSYIVEDEGGLLKQDSNSNSPTGQTVSHEQAS